MVCVCVCVGYVFISWQECVRELKLMKSIWNDRISVQMNHGQYNMICVPFFLPQKFPYFDSPPHRYVSILLHEVHTIWCLIRFLFRYWDINCMCLPNNTLSPYSQTPAHITNTQITFNSLVEAQVLIVPFSISFRISFCSETFISRTVFYCCISLGMLSSYHVHHWRIKLSNHRAIMIMALREFNLNSFS